MNDRLSKDAADALTNLEALGAARQARIAAFGATAKAEWAKAKPRPYSGTWAPTMTPQQKQAHDQYVIAHKLPF